MEYDRALYRVYERIMEDLNASPSPLALTSSASSDAAATNATTAAGMSPSSRSSRDGLLRRRNRGQGGQDDATSPLAAGSSEGEPNDLDLEANVQRDADDNNDPASPESQRSTATNDSNNSERRRGRRQRQAAAARNIPILARRQFSSALQQQQRRHQPLPFLLPIWMARKIDKMNHPTYNMTNSDSSYGVIVQVWNNLRSILLGARGSYDSVATSPSQSRIYRALSLSPSSSRHRDSDHDDDLEEGEGPSSSLQLRELPPLNTDRPSSPSRSSSSDGGLRRRSPTRRDRPSPSPTNQHSTNQTFQDSPRRSGVAPSIPSHSPAPNSTLLQPRNVPHHSPPTSSNASSLSASRSSGEEAAALVNTVRTSRSSSTAATATTTSLAQRAIQTQLRQNERFSSHHGGGRRRRRHRHSPRVANNQDSSSENSSDDDSGSSGSEETDSDATTSSDDEDNDNDRIGQTTHNSNEGCSQQNLYGTMRLSFVIAIFHIFVLIALHVTYIGPYAFRKQHNRRTNVGMLKQRWRRLVKRMDLEDGLLRGLLLGDDSERNHDVDEKDARNMINCISYALSTRPVKDRSGYFGEEKDNKDNPSSDGGSDGKRGLLHDYDEYEEEEAREWDDDELYYLHNDGYNRLPKFGNDDNAVMATFPTSLSSEAVLVAGDSNQHYSSTLQRRLLENNDGTTTSSSTTPLSAAVTKETDSTTPLFGRDEILQIKIMYGGKCTGRCSRVRNVVYPVQESDAENGQNGTTDKEGQLEDQQARSLSEGLTVGSSVDQHDHLLRGLKKQSMQKNDDDNKNGTTAVDESSPTYWEKVHYRFAIDDALLYLDEKSALLHNITLVNVTVTERCLSTGSDDGKLTFLTAAGEFLSQIYGMDSIIINQLMYGIRGMDNAFTSGYVKSMETQERWGWHNEQLETFERNSFVDWVLKKIGIMLMSALAFFLITSVTSLIVRVLTSSGVVLMFPLFACFRALGMPGADERILSLSYPWIGSARVAIANQHVHPQNHLVWAHVTKIVLYYVMYEACQAAWSVVLYAKSIPEALPVWIYGFAMIWEYFSMVFVRSALSVHFFPRVTFLYFFLYHVYFYSVPYGYFDVALIPLFLLMLHAMLYTILGLEAPNARGGVINVECPREVFNRLSWDEPVAALPAEWTMFLPLNSRLSPLHDREISNGTPNNNNNVNDDRAA